jgi:hypothetical protein
MRSNPSMSGLHQRPVFILSVAIWIIACDPEWRTVDGSRPFDARSNKIGDRSMNMDSARDRGLPNDAPWDWPSVTHDNALDVKKPVDKSKPIPDIIKPDKSKPVPDQMKPDKTLAIDATSGVIDVLIHESNTCDITTTPSSIKVKKGTEFTVNWINSGSSASAVDISKIDPYNQVPIIIGLPPGDQYHDSIRKWCGTLYTGTFSFKITGCYNPYYLDVDCGG